MDVNASSSLQTSSGEAVVSLTNGVHVDSADIQPANPAALISGGVQTEEEGLHQKQKSKALEQQLCWDSAMREELGLPGGYKKVAVLIIKWSRRLDQLKCDAEVKELNELLQREFNHKTEIVELDNEKSPQKQLNMELTRFVFHNDGPDNLLIVYYTGHGRLEDQDRRLHLHASDKDETPNGFYPASACWNEAENSSLMTGHVEADILAILDTCYAGSIQHKGPRMESNRTYELLTASGPERRTQAPGKFSFTSALICALEALLRENPGVPISTLQLKQNITLLPERRSNPPFLWYRLQRYDRPIYLTPARREPAAKNKDFDSYSIASHLTIRLDLTAKELEDAQIKELAKQLSRAAKKSKAHVRRINWLHLRSNPHHKGFERFAIVVRVLKRMLARRALKRRAKNAAPEIATPASMSQPESTEC